MASVAGARTLIFHLTAAEAVREVALAKSRGQAAFGEACLTYLLLGPEALDDPVSGTALDFSPPLRSAEHRDALWSGLADGTIDIISTDHGPRRRVADDEGNWTTPPGTSGIEVRLALTHTYGVLEDRLTLHQWIARCCTRPAEIFGLDRKGSLQPGRDADVVIFDPNAELPLSAASLHSNIDHSTYEGHIARGLPITTIVRGTEVIRDRSLVAAAGHGRFVPR
jgi:dihydropyrimidinase